MELDKVKFSQYMYRFKSLEIIVDNKKKKKKVIKVFPEMIGSLIIGEAFETHFFPYFMITLTVTASEYKYLVQQESIGNTAISLELEIGKFDKALYADSSKYNKIQWKPFLKEKYTAITNPDNVNMQSDIEKDLDKKNPRGSMMTMSFLLYNHDFISKYNLIVNGSFKDATITDVITYIANKVGIKKILMSPPDKDPKIPQILLIPTSVTKAFHWLCDKYCIHKKGSLVYFGINRIYIISKDNKCTAFEKGEIKSTYLVDFGLSGSTNKAEVSRDIGGAYKSSKKKISILNTESTLINDKSVLLKKTVGTSILAVNNKGESKKGNDKTSKITRVEVRAGENKSTDKFNNAYKESKKILTTTVKNSDIMMITPNKEYILNLEGKTNKKYNGKYRLSSAMHQFIKEGEIFGVISTLELKGH